MVLAGALVLVGGSYASLMVQNSQQAGSPQAVSPEGPQTPQTPPAEPQTVDSEMIAAEPYMTIGSDDAPVTLYEWTDYTCPYCGVFNRETLPTIISEYVDSGKVRVEVHDVTFIGPQAEDASVAARAAGLQDRYFDFLFAIYGLGSSDNRPDLSQEVLRGLAEDLNLDMQKYDADFANSELREKVQNNTQLAHELGITAVPFFVAADTGTLNGLQNLRGAQSLEQFKEFLDAHVERANS